MTFNLEEVWRVAKRKQRAGLVEAIPLCRSVIHNKNQALGQHLKPFPEPVSEPDKLEAVFDRLVLELGGDRCIDGLEEICVLASKYRRLVEINRFATSLDRQVDDRLLPHFLAIDAPPETALYGLLFGSHRLDFEQFLEDVRALFLPETAYCHIHPDDLVPESRKIRCWYDHLVEYPDRWQGCSRDATRLPRDRNDRFLQFLFRPEVHCGEKLRRLMDRGLSFNTLLNQYRQDDWHGMALFDTVLGIDTGTPPKQGHSSHGGFGYEGTSYAEIGRILEVLDLGRNDTIIDIGGGMGRVACAFATQPLKKVLCIELQTALVAIAARNAQRMFFRAAPLEVVHIDAVDFDYRSGTLFFMFNPFGKETMNAVLKKIHMSIRTNPRNIQILYCNPVLKHTMEREHPWLGTARAIPSSRTILWRVAAPVDRVTAGPS